MGVFIMRRLDKYGKNFIVRNQAELVKMVVYGMEAENGTLQKSDADILYEEDIISKAEWRAIGQGNEEVYQKVLSDIQRTLNKLCPTCWEDCGEYEP